jgi:hypothetical protein
MHHGPCETLCEVAQLLHVNKKSDFKSKTRIYCARYGEVSLEGVSTFTQLFTLTDNWWDVSMAPKNRNLDSIDSPTSPTSPNEWSTSDNAPLLLDESAPDENDKTEDTPKVNTQKAPAVTEFKIALSHFLVSGEHRTPMPELTENQRIFSYSTRNDRLLLTFAVMASLFTGITLPLMNVVFGKL